MAEGEGAGEMGDLKLVGERNVKIQGAAKECS
jgi:hypothetical protein